MSKEIRNKEFLKFLILLILILKNLGYLHFILNQGLGLEK